MSLPPPDSLGPAISAASGAAQNSISGAAGGIMSPIRGPLSDLFRILGTVYHFIMRKIVWIVLIGGIIFILMTRWPYIAAWFAGRGVDSPDDVPEAIGEEIKEGAEAVNEEYERQKSIATGEYQESEIDEYSEQDLGVFVGDIEMGSPSYKFDDPVTAWASIGVDTINEDGTELTIQCYIEDMDTDKRVYGRVNNQEGDELTITVQDEDELEVMCNFPEGVLQEGSNQVMIVINFDFETKAYLKAAFMDGDALRTIKKSNPEMLADIDENPIAKNTEAPVAVGIGSRSNPIPLGAMDSQVLPSLGVSITNNWYGRLTSVESVEIVVPSAVQLQNCESTRDVAESSNPDYPSAFYNVYQVNDEGIIYMNELILNDEDDFIIQNVRCQMLVDKNAMLSGSSLLTPVTKTIFVNAKYNYQIKESKNIVVAENEGVVVRFRASGYSNMPVSLNDEIECVGTYYDGDVASAEYQIEHIRDGKILATSETQTASCKTSRSCTSNVLLFGQGFLSGINPLKGDTIKCTMIITPRETGVPLSPNSRYAIIQNAQPKIEDLDILPTSPKNSDDITCSATVLDMDGDAVTATYRLRIGSEEVKNGDAECTALSEDTYTCIATLPAAATSPDDYVYCEMVANDGTAPSEMEYADEYIAED